MADYGFKSSVAGGNVLTAADDDLAFSTKFQSIKIYKTGTLSVSTDGSGDGSDSEAHDLGFAPAFRAFILDSGAYFPDAPHFSYINSSWNRVHVYTDASNIYAQALGATPSDTYTIKYFMFADLAQSYSGTSSSLAQTYGLKISNPGIEVTTAKIYQLSFTSSLKNMRYDPSKTGSTTMSLDEKGCIDNYPTGGDDQTTSTSVSHGLGYPPFFMSWFKTNNTQIYGPTTYKVAIPFFREDDMDVVDYSLECSCDSTNLYFYWRRYPNCLSLPPDGVCDLVCWNFPDETVTIYYYIFREDLSAI